MPRTDERIPLWPFQHDALAAILEAHKNGVRRDVVAIPTGGGKTILATHIVDAFGHPAVFMCHRDELVTQTVDKFGRFDPSLRIAICKAEAGRRGDELRGRDLIVASAQTLARPARRDVLTAAIGRPKILIVDEAHHAAAETWRDTIDALDADHVVGLTATPKRGDDVALDGVFEQITYAIPMVKLVDQGLLARPIGIAISTGTDLDGVATRQGDFAVGQLEDAVNTPERNDVIVRAWNEHASDRITIAFAVDVQHARDLADAFKATGVAAAAVLGDTPKDERRRLYRDLKNGELRVLVSCMVLTEGFDEPAVSCAIMARPTKSAPLYIQMAGRALRHAAGKPDALILDFVDNASRHRLQTVLTLAGKDSADLTPEERDAVERGEQLDLFAREARLKRAEYRSKRLGDLLTLSEYVWQRGKDGIAFASTGQGREWIAVLPEGREGDVVPVVVRQFPDQNWRVSVERLFGRPVDPDTAIMIASNSIPRSKLTLSEAEWRERAPSEKQVALAAKLGIRDAAFLSRGELTSRIDAEFFRRALRQWNRQQHEGAF